MSGYYRNILLCVFFLHVVNSANILMYMGAGAPSHKVTYWSLAKGLAARGHNITFIGAMPAYEVKVENITEIPATTFKDIVWTAKSPVEDRTNEKYFTQVFVEYSFWDARISEVMFKTQEIRDFINSGVKLDLVIMNPMFGDNALGFVDQHKVPYIYFGTSGIYDWITPIFGNPLMTNYKSSIAVITSQDVTKFVQRMVTTLVTHGFRLMQIFYVYPRLEKVWKEIRGEENVGSFLEAEKYARLMFLNSHIALEPAIPYLPNIIEVGGIHLQEPQPLPQHLSDFAESSGKHGFIFFSMGTVIQEELMEVEQCESLLDSFAQLDQKVLWKWKTDNVKNLTLPENVRLEKWVPQNDILAHPKIRLFITHGGKLGTTEALSHGVPLLVIPIFTDQDGNAHTAVRNGYGHKLDLKDLRSKDIVLEAIQTALFNESIRVKAHEFSAILHDNPVPPLEKAIYWVEYVLRHRNDRPLMESPSKSMYWFQTYMMDVYLVLILLLLVLSYLIFKVIWFVVKFNLSLIRK